MRRKSAHALPLARTRNPLQLTKNAATPERRTAPNRVALHSKSHRPGGSTTGVMRRSTAVESGSTRRMSASVCHCSSFATLDQKTLYSAATGTHVAAANVPAQFR